MTEFQAGQSAVFAHSSLKSSLQTMAKAKRCAVLWFGEILDRGLFRELGYSSMNQYAAVELGFSRSRTGDFMNLCRKLKKLPRVKARVADGSLDYTKARVLVGVADQKNEGAWLEAAEGCSRRELGRKVKRAKQAAVVAQSGQGSLLPDSAAAATPPAAAPVRVSLEMTPAQFARYEALWEQIRKKGGVSADKVEALLAVMAGYGGESATRVDIQPPAQIHIHQCPDCAKATVQTSKGELELDSAEREQARCDCRMSEPGKRNTSAIPPAVRRKVLARDRHRCQGPGCPNTRFLQIQYRTPRSCGGTNAEENLITLCSACHRLLHEKGVSLAEEGRLGGLYHDPACPGCRCCWGYDYGRPW